MQVVSAAVGVRACKECACVLKLSWSGCILSWSGCMWSEAGLEWLHKIRTVQVVSAAVGVRACVHVMVKGSMKAVRVGIR